MSKNSVKEWAANMAGGTTKPTLRMKDHPKVQELERKLLLFYNPALPMSPDLEALVHSVSRSLFSTDRLDTVLHPPELPGDRSTQQEVDAYWQALDRFEAHEAKFDELYCEADTLIPLRRLGVDFSDASGRPLNCLHLLDRQAFAAAKGICGNLPGRSEFATQLFETSLQAAADEWQRQKRKSRQRTTG